MKNLVRIEEIEINGIKNVCHGNIRFQEYNHLEKGNFDDLNSVLGIYGPNGSGKTTVLEVTKLLKTILTGNKIPDSINQFIHNDSDHAKISYTFFIQTEQVKQLVTYTFKIGLIEDHYEIYSEKIVAKEYSEEEQKWKPQVTLIECSSNEIVFKKLRNKLSKESLIELRVAKEIEKETSFIFHERNRKILIKQLRQEDKCLLVVLGLLPLYAEEKLFIIENDLIGSINLNTFVPINLYLSSEDMVTIGRYPVNLLIPNEIEIERFNAFEKVIKQIDIVLNAIIPSIHLKIVNEKEQYLENGENGISFEVVSVRNDKYIPLKYESEGIKRLISVISSMIAAYNDPSICLMIDEFDSGIFEYLLGELIEIIDESAKGQFVFTSHNLRALEKLSYKSIMITTYNPDNRYIQMKGIKPNNNVRDYYYKNIMLGGQNEVIYEETKNYQIKRAFRKAGK